MSTQPTQPAAPAPDGVPVPVAHLVVMYSPATGGFSYQCTHHPLLPQDGFAAALERAAEALRAGQFIVDPTFETGGPSC